MTIRSRDLRRYAQAGHHRFDSLEAFTAAPIKPGVSSVLINNRWLDLRFEDRGSDTTLVYFHAALPATWGTYPFFGGSGLFKGVSANYLALSDPLIGARESLATGWFAGSRRLGSQAVLPKVIDHAAETGGGHRLVFFGASAGGFAALYYSARFAGSVAVVVNPVTDIKQPEQIFPLYSAAAWEGLDEAGILRRIESSVVDLYARGTSNTVIYLQNLQDPTYVWGHLRPFLISNPGRSNIHLRLGTWDRGHVVPPKEVMREAVDLLLEADSDCGGGLDPKLYRRSPTAEYLLAELSGAQA
ncbi:hypothetical protein [Arthrobacter sp. KK5.5]|uniref:hypothetical protein n=1 Tax=Arthrobacter sp. KK5.5 TaxID=3373084 RepID=UPI003EE6F694